LAQMRACIGQNTAKCILGWQTYGLNHYCHATHHWTKSAKPSIATAHKKSRQTGGIFFDSSYSIPYKFPKFGVLVIHRTMPSHHRHVSKNHYIHSIRRYMKPGLILYPVQTKPKKHPDHWDRGQGHHHP